MRYLLALPVSAFLVGLFNVVAAAGMMMDWESLYYDTVLPSEAEFFLKLGELLTAAGILALILVAWRAMKCPAIAPITAVLAGLVAVVAAFEFFMVGYCGTPTFFFLLLVAVSECAIAGIAWMRRAV